MRILKTVLLLLPLAQLAVPWNDIPGYRSTRYGTFAVHDGIGCDKASIIKEEGYGGCMNIEDDAKSFYWRMNHWTHLAYGHLEADCKDDRIWLGGAGEVCLPVDLQDLDSIEHWYRPGVGVKKPVPDLNWEGRLKSVSFTRFLGHDMKGYW